MAADIATRSDMEVRLPCLVSYALHQDSFYSAFRAAELIENSRVKKALIRGFTLYASESPWPDQVDFVAYRLLTDAGARSAQTRRLVARTKQLTSEHERAEARRRIVQRARLTEQARPYQLAVLKDIGWSDSAQWLGRQPFAASGDVRRPTYTPEEIRALKLPKVAGDSAGKSRSKRPRPVAPVSRPKPEQMSAPNDGIVGEPHGALEASQPVEPPVYSLPAQLSGGALVVFDDFIFANLKRRLEVSGWRVVSADTYFLAEALSVHQRWMIKFPAKIRITSGLVVEAMEVRVQPKGLVIDLWRSSGAIDRVNFQRSLLRSQMQIPDDVKQGVGLILLYIFNGSRRLKKSTSKADVQISETISDRHFPISSVYRIRTASSLSDIGIHARVLGAGNHETSKPHDVRGHTRRVRGTEYQVRAHRRGK